MFFFQNKGWELSINIDIDHFILESTGNFTHIPQIVMDLALVVCSDKLMPESLIIHVCYRRLPPNYSKEMHHKDVLVLLHGKHRCISQRLLPIWAHLNANSVYIHVYDKLLLAKLHYQSEISQQHVYIWVIVFIKQIR